MKKGEVYIADFGNVRIQSIGKLGVKVVYLTGKLKGKEANIEKGMMKGKKRFIETETKEKE